MPYHLSLRRYVESRPERFYDHASHDVYFEWLESHRASHRKALQRHLKGAEEELNRAIGFLREINIARWHDQLLPSGDEYELIRFIDQDFHPTYLRLIEGVLVPLLRPIAFLSRQSRGKGTDDLNEVWPVVEEVRRSASQLVDPYRQTVRNGIAHGAITFRQTDIRYQDKNGNVDTVGSKDVVRLCDDLLDTCNGLVSALTLFYCVAHADGFAPPRELMIDELRQATDTPWWSVVGCVESEIFGRSQLLIFVRLTTRHYSKALWAAVQTGVLAEYFAQGYDRYFLSLQSPVAWPGWAGFDGKKLRLLRKAGATDLEQYRGIIENNTFFYVPTPGLPNWLGKLDTIAKSFQLQTPTTIAQLRKQLGIPQLECRNASAHRNGWGVVVRGAVLIGDTDDASLPNTIRRHKGRILAEARKTCRRAGSRVARLPVAFAEVAVYRRDYRRRRFSSFGLGSDLVCTVRLQRMARINTPDISGSVVESYGRWRIAWNRAWLESTGREVELP